MEDGVGVRERLDLPLVEQSKSAVACFAVQHLPRQAALFGNPCPRVCQDGADHGQTPK